MSYPTEQPEQKFVSVASLTLLDSRIPAEDIPNPVSPEGGKLFPKVVYYFQNEGAKMWPKQLIVDCQVPISPMGRLYNIKYYNTENPILMLSVSLIDIVLMLGDDIKIIIFYFKWISVTFAIPKCVMRRHVRVISSHLK